MRYIVVRTVDGKYTVVWEHSSVRDWDGHEVVLGPSSHEEATEEARRLELCRSVTES